MSSQICFTVTTIAYMMMVLATNNVSYRAFYLNYGHNTVFVIYCALFPIIVAWSISELKNRLLKTQVAPVAEMAEQDLRLSRLNEIWNSTFDTRRSNEN